MACISETKDQNLMIWAQRMSQRLRGNGMNVISHSILFLAACRLKNPNFNSFKYVGILGWDNSMKLPNEWLGLSLTSRYMSSLLTFRPEVASWWILKSAIIVGFSGVGDPLGNWICYDTKHINNIRYTKTNWIDFNIGIKEASITPA